MISRTTFRVFLIACVLYFLYLFTPILYIRFEIANQLDRLTVKSSQMKNIEIEKNIKNYVNTLGQRIKVKSIDIKRNQSKIKLNYDQTVCLIGGWEKSCLLQIDHNLESWG